MKVSLLKPNQESDIPSLFHNLFIISKSLSLAHIQGEVTQEGEYQGVENHLGLPLKASHHTQLV